MALGKVEDEKRKITQCQGNTKALRDRFEDDYESWRLQSFEIPTEEGKWDNFTTNTPAVHGNKLMNLLADADVKLWIEIADEGQRDRKTISSTEKLAIGAIELADSLLTSTPESVSTQSALAWDAAILGWTALRFYIYEEDDAIIPDIAVWSLLNTHWISGSKGLLWASYKRYGNKYQLEEEYKGSITVEEDQFGRVEVYNVWDTEEEGTFIGGEWVKPPEKHGLNYIPVLIRPVGATRLFQSGRHHDTMVDVGMNAFANNRNLFKTESRLLSYNLTRAGMLAKTPNIIEFDRDKSPLPDDIELNPSYKGSIVFLDAAKGQRFVQQLPPPSGHDINQMTSQVLGMESLGFISPISFGQINQALPAQGIDILHHAAMDIVKPFKANIEANFKWIAEETVRQYKHGEFGSFDLAGRDRNNKKFTVTVKPDDINDNWRFESELVLDLLRDKAALLGMVIQAMGAGLISKQTARDFAQLVDDTDQEQKTIDREEAEEVTQIKLWNMAKAMIDEGNEWGFDVVMNKIRQAQAAEAGQAGQAVGGGGIQAKQVLGGEAPQGIVGGMQLNPEVEQNMKLRAMGLERGR
jgi:hypothetical protein|tara:strand:- start:647 stop:2389 length:1743 start_codon:yes stop_codon:yes gene_type:complete